MRSAVRDLLRRVIYGCRRELGPGHPFPDVLVYRCSRSAREFWWL